MGSVDAGLVAIDGSSRPASRDSNASPSSISAQHPARRVEKASQDAISAVEATKSDQERLDAAVREDGPQLEVAQARVGVADTAVVEARLEREVELRRAEFGLDRLDPGL